MHNGLGDRGELRRGLPVVAGGLIGMAVQAAAYISLGTMMTPLMTAFGWSRTQIVVVAAFNAVLAIAIAPLVGSLLDRFGPRRVALWGFVAYPLALAGAGLTGPRIEGWWAVWIVIATANFFVGPLVWTNAVTKSFVRRRGLAIGIVLSGMGIANALIPLYLVGAINALGWRGAYVALAALVMLVGGGMTWCVFRPPAHQRSSGTSAPLEGHGMSAAQAMCTTRYWRLCIVIFLVSAAIGTLNLHLQPMFIDTGATMVGAAAIASMFGPAQIAGRLTGGWLLDRVPGTLLGPVTFMLPTIGCVLIMSGHGRGKLAFLVPLCIGFAAGVELDLATYMASRYFGPRHFGSIFAGIFCFFILGYTGGPLAAAYVRDASGDYISVLAAIAAALPVAALLVGTLGRYPKGWKST
jgi:MFS family permease